MWGPPTWVFLHALCEKINPNHYLVIKESLWNKLKELCANLPCPDCAEHATTYLNGINFRTIQTKEQLKVWKMGGLVLGTSICSKSNYRSWSFLVQNRSKSFTFEIETNTKLSLRETQIRISKIACFIFKNDTLNG